MEEQAAEIERLRKEKEEMQVRMDQMMEIVNNLKQQITEKAIDQSGGQNTPLYPSGFEPVTIHASQNAGTSTSIPQTQATSHFIFPPQQPPKPSQFPPPRPFEGYPYSINDMPPQPMGTHSTPFVPASITNAVPVFPGQEATNPIRVDDGEKDDEKTSKLISMFDERLKMVEGYNYHKALNATEATLVPGLVIPSKFKVPEFDKYKGASDPEQHLMTYVRKMAAHVDNDKLMIHFFQDSLTGAASRWYNELDSTKIKT